MFEDLKTAARLCHWRDLDDVVKQTYAVWGEGDLTDEQATYILEGIIQPRRKWKDAPKPEPKTRAAETYVGTRPISARSNPDRRMLSRETFVRPEDTKDLTNGEAAVLTVVTEEIIKAGACRLSVGKLAAIAGISNRWAQHALRKLAALCFLVVEHRPITRRRNDTNEVTLHPCRQELGDRLKRVKRWWRGRGRLSNIGRTLVRSTRLKGLNRIPLMRDISLIEAPAAPGWLSEGSSAKPAPS